MKFLQKPLEVNFWKVRLKNLLGAFRDRKHKEMYRLCYKNLVYVSSYMIDHFNENFHMQKW